MSARVWRAAPEDAERMAALHARAFDDAWPAEAFAALLRRDAVAGLLGASKGADEPQGMILIQAAGGEAEVLTLCVADASRRLGLGQALLGEARTIARGAGAERLFLEVAESNEAACALYHKLGFRTVGRRKAYYNQGAGAADALVMRLDLDPPPKPDGT